MTSWYTHFSDIGHTSCNKGTNCEAVDEFTGEEHRVGRCNSFDSDANEDNDKVDEVHKFPADLV
jgi:hypothetical protein